VPLEIFAQSSKKTGAAPQRCALALPFPIFEGKNFEKKVI
jgi:hypothetical protein